MKRHIIHYLVLLILMALGTFGLVYFRFDRLSQMGAAIALAVSYVAWGIVHHKIHRDLHPETAVEYIAIAILGLVIIFSLLFRL